MAQSFPTAPGKLGTISGQVLDAATGQPIKMALLQLRPETESTRPSQSRADDSGTYSLDNIAPGRYRLSAVRNGYLRQEYGAKSPNHPGVLLDVRSGQNLSDLMIRLTAQAAISGKVVDDRGEAIVNVSVQAMRYGFANGKTQLSVTKGALTNDLGEYRIFGLPPGRYYISAVAQDLSPAPALASKEDAESDGFVPVFYPGATDAGGAASIEVSGGQDYRGADLRLVRTHTVRIRGVVQSAVPGKAGRFMIRLMPPNSGIFGIVAGKFTSSIGPKGEFELQNVAPGSYVLSAEYIVNGNRYSTRQLLDVGASVPESVRLVIGPGTEISGRVRIGDGTSESLSAVRIKLTPSDSTMFESKEALVSADGSFAFLHVAADTYTVEVRNLPDGAYLKSIRLGDQDVLKSHLLVPEGGVGAKLEVVGSKNGGKIDGAVVTAEQKPAPGISVVVVPDTEDAIRSDLLRLVSSDQHGVFSVSGVAPGKYRAFAVETIDDPGVFFDRQFLRKLGDAGKALVVDEKGLVHVQLTLMSSLARN